MKLLKYLFFSIAAVMLLQSCSEPQAGQWKNEQIDAGMRAKLHKLNDQMFKLLKEDDDKQIGNMLSKEMMESHDTPKQSEWLSHQLNKADFTIYDEYYVVNKWKDADTIINKTRGANSYRLNFAGEAREMYIVFFLPKTGFEKKMITLVYGKLDYGWKVIQMDLGAYMVNGKTAPELYQLAMEKLSKGYLSDAVSTMQLSNECSNPSALMEYPADSLSRGFFETVIAKANDTYTFPLVVNQVPTHPKIFRVSNNESPDGKYPQVSYLSTVSLKDTKAIEKENAAVQKVIGKMIAGIDKDKKYLFYCVYNEKPNNARSVDRYEITEKIDAK